MSTTAVFESLLPPAESMERDSRVPSHGDHGGGKKTTGGRSGSSNF